METVLWSVEQGYDYEGESLVGIYSTKDLAGERVKDLFGKGEYIEYAIVSEVNLDGNIIARWRTRDGENWSRA